MKVSELIALLSQHAPDAQIYVTTSADFDPADGDNVTVEFALAPSDDGAMVWITPGETV